MNAVDLRVGMHSQTEVLAQRLREAGVKHGTATVVTVVGASVSLDGMVFFCHTESVVVHGVFAGSEDDSPMKELSQIRGRSVPGTQNLCGVISLNGSTQFDLIDPETIPDIFEAAA